MSEGIGKLVRRPSVSWVVSALVHIVVMILLATVAVVYQGHQQPATLHVALERHPLPLEALGPLADEPAMAELPVVGHVTQVLELPLPDVAWPDATAELSESPAGPDRQPQATGAADGAGMDDQGRAEFFGTVAYGNRFVYILDVSGSMNLRSGTGSRTRMERAAAELLASVERLQDDQSFYVLLFSTDTRWMFDEQLAVRAAPRLPEMRRATAENKRRLRQWLTSISGSGSTDPRESLRVALRMQPSAIFLLSDGEFNGQQQRLNRRLFRNNPSAEQVIALHRTDNTPIHTFAYEDPSSRLRLERLAAANDGTFVYVAPEQHAPPAARAAAVPSASPVDQRRAAGWLRIANRLQSQGRADEALQRLAQIVETYPDTQAAEQARLRLAE